MLTASCVRRRAASSTWWRIPEQREVSSEHPDVVASMSKELERQAADMWETSHQEDPACDLAAFSLYGGFYGPCKELESAFHVV